MCSHLNHNFSREATAEKLLASPVQTLVKVTADRIAAFYARPSRTATGNAVKFSCNVKCNGTFDIKLSLDFSFNFLLHKVSEDFFLQVGNTNK